MLVAGCGALLGIEDVPSPSDGGDAQAKGGSGAHADSGIGGGSAKGGKGGSGAAGGTGGIGGVNAGGVSATGGNSGSGGSAGAGCPAQYVCASAAPTGWSGPIALVSVAGSSFPPCGGDYTTVVSTGHDGLNAAAAACTCTCPAQSSGATCSNQLSAHGYSISTCTGTPSTNNTYTAEVCSAAPATINVIAVASVASPGACTPSSSKNVAPPTWANSYAVCGYTGPQGAACGSSGSCVAAPGSSSWPNPCIYASGDQPCPGVPYTQKTTFTTTLDDSRDCTTCSCDVSGGSCSAVGSSYNAASCGGTATTLPADGTCRLTPSVKSIKFTTPYLTASPACTSNGGVATGSATASTPITVCCEP